MGNTDHTFYITIVKSYLKMFFLSLVLSSVVCEIGPLDPEKVHWGQVEVEVKGGKRGTSSMYFTYRVNTLSYSHTHAFSSAALPVWRRRTFDLENKHIQKLSTDLDVLLSQLCFPFPNC